MFSGEWFGHLDDFPPRLPHFDGLVEVHSLPRGLHHLCGEPLESGVFREGGYMQMQTRKVKQPSKTIKQCHVKNLFSLLFNSQQLFCIISWIDDRYRNDQFFVWCWFERLCAGHFFETAFGGSCWEWACQEVPWPWIFGHRMCIHDFIKSKYNIVQPSVDMYEYETPSCTGKRPPLEVRIAGQHLICSMQIIFPGWPWGKHHVLERSCSDQTQLVFHQHAMAWDFVEWMHQHHRTSDVRKDWLWWSDAERGWGLGPSFSPQVPFKAVINRVALNTQQCQFPHFVYLCFMCFCFSQTMGVLLYLEKQSSEQW